MITRISALRPHPPLSTDSGPLKPSSMNNKLSSATSGQAAPCAQILNTAPLGRYHMSPWHNTIIDIIQISGALSPITNI